MNFSKIYRLVLVACFSLLTTSQLFSAVVTDEDEMWHNMGKSEDKMAYEWFYFDIHNADGSSLVVAFLGPNPYDTSKMSLISPQGIKKHIGVSVQAVAADGKRWEVLNFTRKNKVSFTADPFELKMNESRLSMRKLPNGLPEYSLDLDAVDTNTGMKVKGRILMTSLMKGWKHKEGHVYSDKKTNPKKYHKWVVTVPKATVDGWVKFDSKKGETSNIVKFTNASGYHDHNYGTLPIANTTDGWYWGRAEVNDKIIIYSKIFGKSRPAFLGDFAYEKNPASTVIFVGTEDEVLVDSDKMIFNDYGPQNKTTLSNGMVVPKNYSMSVQGLNSEYYHLDVFPTTPLAVSVPYYSRQGGLITLCENHSPTPDAYCEKEQSRTIISEQIDYPRYLQLVLGLPKPLKF